MDLKNKNTVIAIILVVMAIAIGVTLFWGLDGTNGNSNHKVQIEPDSMLTGNKYIDKTIEGLRVNNSEKVKEVKTVDGLEIKIEHLTSSNNYTTILGTVKNTTSNEVKEADITLTVLDDKGNELAKESLGKVIPALAENQELELNISIIKDYANAYDLKFERAK